MTQEQKIDQLDKAFNAIVNAMNETANLGGIPEVYALKQNLGTAFVAVEKALRELDSAMVKE